MQNDDPLALDNQLCFALYSTSLAMTQVYKPLLEPLGLTYPQYLIMLILWESDGIGLKDIGARLGQKSGALTPVIKRLEQDGWVLRVRDAEDERALSIRLTEQGKALRTQVLDLNKCVVETAGMTLDDVIDLREKLNRLRSNIQAD